ncbi:hypothetical protein EE612_025754, partial [Oryza sativa]
KESTVMEAATTNIFYRPSSSSPCSFVSNTVRPALHRTRFGNGR